MTLCFSEDPGVIPLPSKSESGKRAQNRKDSKVTRGLVKKAALTLETKSYFPAVLGWEEQLPFLPPPHCMPQKTTCPVLWVRPDNLKGLFPS